MADEKVKVFEGGGRGGNMEHQPSGLIWNLDNWIYITYQNVRYRYTNGEFKTERLPRGGGQWGLTADDDGRICAIDVESITADELIGLSFAKASERWLGPWRDEYLQHLNRPGVPDFRPSTGASES